MACVPCWDEGGLDGQEAVLCVSSCACRTAKWSLSWPSELREVLIWLGAAHFMAVPPTAL